MISLIPFTWIAGPGFLCLWSYKLNLVESVFWNGLSYIRKFNNFWRKWNGVVQIKKYPFLSFFFYYLVSKARIKWRRQNKWHHIFDVKKQRHNKFKWLLFKAPGSQGLRIFFLKDIWEMALLCTHQSGSVLYPVKHGHTDVQMRS